jgi:cell division protein FtsN
MKPMPDLTDNLDRGKRLLTEHNNIWVLLAMSVVIAVLIVAWWAVSDAFSISGIGKVDKSEPVANVSPAVVSSSQTDEISALTDTLRDLNETARMLMDSITYLETKLVRAHVLSDNLIEDSQALITARGEPRTVQPGSVKTGTAQSDTAQRESLALVESLPSPAAGPGPEAAGASGASSAAESATELQPVETVVKRPVGKDNESQATRVTGKIQREAVTASAVVTGHKAQPKREVPQSEEQEAVTIATARTAQKEQLAGKVLQSSEPETGKTHVATVTETPKKRTNATVSRAEAPVSSRHEGQWVINLASLGSRQQAENFQSKAGMKGFDTSLQQATVRGKEYWRVQVTGLATRNEAEARGEAIKQRLGLKEIWISKR